MPVADHDVLRDQVDGPVRIIIAGFPEPQSRRFAVDETIPPDPHFPALLNEMVMDGPYFPCEEYRLVHTGATGAFIFPQVKDLIHARMKGIRLENITKLVDHREQHLMQPGHQRAIAPAV